MLQKTWRLGPDGDDCLYHFSADLSTKVVAGGPRGGLAMEPNGPRDFTLLSPGSPVPVPVKNYVVHWDF